MRAGASRFFVTVSLLGFAFLWSQFLVGAEQSVPRRTFTEFPLTIGGWEGRELGLDEGVLQILQVDDYMMRLYNNAGETPVALYVGYYSSLGQVAYHSPKYCLPGGGWQIVHQRVVEIPLGPGPSPLLKANYVILQKGTDRQLFLYWYQDRGRNITNDYWAKFYVLWDSITRNRTDGALVRFSSSVRGAEDEAFAHQVEFIRGTLPLLGDYLPG
jgi:EpsI family protein